LMYPRPVLVAAAVLDFFPIEGTRRTFRELEKLYTRFGRGDRIALVEGYHQHQYSAENQQAALDFLDHFNQMPVRTGRPPVKELSSETLRCTRTGQVLLDYSDARSLMGVIREYYEQRKEGNPQTLAKQYNDDNHSGVREWDVSEYANVPPQAGQIAWEGIGGSSFEGARID